MNPVDRTSSESSRTKTDLMQDRNQELPVQPEPRSVNAAKNNGDLRPGIQLKALEAGVINKEFNTRASSDDGDVIMVDWEGPDDPENPKK